MLNAKNLSSYSTQWQHSSSTKYNITYFQISLMDSVTKINFSLAKISVRLHVNTSFITMKCKLFKIIYKTSFQIHLFSKSFKQEHSIQIAPYFFSIFFNRVLEFQSKKITLGDNGSVKNQSRWILFRKFKFLPHIKCRYIAFIEGFSFHTAIQKLHDYFPNITASDGIQNEHIFGAIYASQY